MKRILVTGASGFIGKNLVNYLQRVGLEPIAWVRSIESANAIRDVCPLVHVGALNDTRILAEEKNRLSAIIHLAGSVSPTGISPAYELNVEATQRIADVCSGWDQPPTMVYVSSLSASGPCVGGQPRREVDPCQPLSIYGETKAAAEKALQSFSDRLPISIVRPPGVFGPWDRNLLQLYQMVRYGWNLVGISKQFRYSFVHVDDLVQGLSVVMQRGDRLRGPDDPDATGIYFLADDQPVTFVEMANLIASSLGISPPRHLQVPGPLCWAIAGGTELSGKLFGLRSYFNLDKMREAAGGSWVCDSLRARQELGFQVAQPLTQRIIETTEWYRRQSWLQG